jgi:hypothetical protein
MPGLSDEEVLAKTSGSGLSDEEVLAQTKPALAATKQPAPPQNDDFLPRKARIATNAILEGAAAVPDMLGNLPNNVLNLSKAAAGTVATALGRPDLAQPITENPDAVRKLLQSIPYLYNKNVTPTTGVERAIDVLLQGASAGALTGGVGGLRSAITGGLSGATSTGAAASTQALAQKAKLSDSQQNALAVAAGLLAPSITTALGGTLPKKMSVRTADIPEERVAAYRGMTEKGARPQGSALVFGEPNKNVKGQQAVANEIYNESVGLPKSNTFGKKELQTGKDKISAEYDRILNGRQIPLDAKFSADMAALEAEQKALARSGPMFPEVKSVFDTIRTLGGAGGIKIDGKLYNQLRSQLGSDAQRAKNDIDRSNLLRRMQKALDDAAERNLPQDVAQDLSVARGQYQNLMILSDAMAGKGPGFVTPAQVGKEWANRVGQKVLYEKQTPLKELGEWGLSLSGEQTLGPEFSGVGLHIPGTPLKTNVQAISRALQTPVTALRARGIASPTFNAKAADIEKALQEAQKRAAIPTAAILPSTAP